MGKKKSFRERGKIKLSHYFKRLDIGSDVCVVREKSVKCSFPDRVIGRSGKIIGIRGSHCVIKINDLDKEKIFIIHPIHLKKIMNLAPKIELKKQVKTKK